MLETIIIILAVVFDQVSKYIAAANLPNINDSAQFIPGIIEFRRAPNNKGAGWSFLGNWEYGTLFLTIFSIAMVALLVYLIIYLRKNNSPWQINACFAMIIGGALGNIIDRIFIGSVIDFLCFEFIEFPIFNVADCFVTVGVALLIAYFIFSKKGRVFAKQLDDKPKKRKKAELENE